MDGLCGSLEAVAGHRKKSHGDVMILYHKNYKNNNNIQIYNNDVMNIWNNNE